MLRSLVPGLAVAGVVALAVFLVLREERDAEAAALAAEIKALEIRPPVVPMRIHDMRRQEESPASPAAVAGPWTALSGTFEIRMAGKDSRRVRFTRNDRALYQVAMDGGWEWLFRRNPVDSARVSACQADHREKILVDHTDAELAGTGTGCAWDRHAALGVAPADLAGLAPSGERVERFGLVFVLLRRPAAGAGLEEVWWNGEHRLPLRARFQGGDGPWELELLALDRLVADHPVPDLAERYPDYTRVDRADLADFLEGKGAIR